MKLLWLCCIYIWCYDYHSKTIWWKPFFFTAKTWKKKLAKTLLPKLVAILKIAHLKTYYNKEVSESLKSTLSRARIAEFTWSGFISEGTAWWLLSRCYVISFSRHRTTTFSGYFDDVFVENLCISNFHEPPWVVKTGCLSVQKQPFKDVIHFMCCWKFRKTHRKTPVPESLIIKIIFSNNILIKKEAVTIIFLLI